MNQTFMVLNNWNFLKRNIFVIYKNFTIKFFFLRTTTVNEIFSVFTLKSPSSYNYITVQTNIIYYYMLTRSPRSILVHSITAQSSPIRLEFHTSYLQEFWDAYYGFCYWKWYLHKSTCYNFSLFYLLPPPLDLDLFGVNL